MAAGKAAMNWDYTKGTLRPSKPAEAYEPAGDRRMFNAFVAVVVAAFASVVIFVLVVL